MSHQKLLRTLRIGYSTGRNDSTLLCNVDWCLLFVKEGLMAPNHAFEIGLAPAVFAAQRKGYASHVIEKKSGTDHGFSIYANILFYI